MKRASYFLFFILVFGVTTCIAQSIATAPLIVNEIGFGQNGTSKYIELLVVGNTNNTSLSPINLEGWIIDNDTQNATGDSTFLMLGSAFSALFPGTVILIYDDSQSNPNINQANNGTPNAGGIYQVPVSSSSLTKCIKGASFECTTTSSATNWDAIIPIDKAGDVVQIRDPQGTLSYAVNWSGAGFGSAAAPQTISIAGNAGNPEMPVVLREWCDHYEVTYERTATASPGHYNSLNNGNFINGLASGSAISSLYLHTEEQVFLSPEDDFGHIDIEVGGGVAPYTVGWTGPSSGSMPISDAGTYQISNLLPGHYVITIIDSKNCSKTKAVWLRITDEQTICQGECIEIGEPTFECFHWEPKEGLLNPNESVTDACPQEPTTYTLTIIDAEGNIVSQNKYEVEVIQLEVEINPDPAVLCDGSTVELVATPGYSTYAWSNTTGTFSGSGEVVEVSEAGNYSVTVTDEQGCSGVADAEIVLVNDIQSFREYLDLDGYCCIPVDDLIYTPYQNAGNIVNEKAQLTIEYQGQIVDVNADLNTYLGALANHLSAVKGEISFYDETNLDCNNLPLKGSRNLAEEYLYKVNVIGTIAADGSKTLCIKIDNNLPPPALPDGTNTLYLIELAGAGVSMQGVKNWINHYFDVLYSVPCPGGNQKNLEIEIVDFVPQDQLKSSDALSLIGNGSGVYGSEIVTMASNYCGIINEEDVENWLIGGNSLEQGQSDGRRQISYARTDLIDNNVLNDYKCSTKEQLVGFLVFHAMGHNAGITHGVGTNQGSGYMDEGKCIPWWLGKWPSTCINFPNNSPYASLGELITNTSCHIIEKVKTRFK